MRTLAVAILIPLLLLLAAFGPPIFALLAYVWYGFFRPQDWVHIDITAYNVSLVFGVLLVIRATMAGALPYLRHRISIGIVAFVAASLLAQTNAFAPSVGWEWIDYFARVALLCLLTISLIDNPRKLYLFALVLTASLGFHTSKAGAVAMLTGGRIAFGYGGVFPDNNGFALASAMLLPIMLGLARSVPKDWRLRGAIASALYIGAFGNVLTIIWTFSRGGLLAMVTALAVFFALQRGNRLKFAVAGAILVGASGLAIELPEGYLDRIETIKTYEEVEEESALSRLHFWATAVEMVVDHPLGIGIQNFPYAYDAYDTSNGKFGRGRPVHSAHFQVLAELGALGFAVWVALFAMAGSICMRIRRASAGSDDEAQQARAVSPVSNGLFASMLAFAVGGAFGNLAYNDLTWLTFAMIAASDRIARHATVSLYRRSKPLPVRAAMRS